MKPSRIERLALLRRLAQVQDEHASRAVRERRQALETSRREAMMLESYRQDLCLANHAEQLHNGKSLRTYAAFGDMAEAARAQAQAIVSGDEARLQQALQRLARVRERVRRIDEQYHLARRSASVQLQRRIEQDLPPRAPRRRA